MFIVKGDGKLIVVNSKAVLSGNILEIYDYKKGYSKGYVLNIDERAKKGRKKGDIDSSNDKYREKVLNKARRSIRRILEANIGQYGDDKITKFLTLTFSDNVNDLEVANYEFKKFIQRLNYEVFGKKGNELKYLCKPEFQKRGAVHYHVVIFNMPYVKSKIIEDIWGNGFIKINRTKGVKNLVGYICKYLYKGIDDERMKGKKSYFTSRGLKDSMEIYDEELIERVKRVLDKKKLVYENTFKNEMLEEVSYKKYIIDDGEMEVKEIFKMGGFKSE
jgi:hypothetical protein